MAPMVGDVGEAQSLVEKPLSLAFDGILEQRGVIADQHYALVFQLELVASSNFYNI